MKCFYHAEIDATGECITCGKPLCGGCLGDSGASGGKCRKCARSCTEVSSGLNTAAGITSIFVPGLGQLIRGEFVKAAAIFILFVYAMSQELFAAGLLVYMIGIWDGFRHLITEEELGLATGRGHVYAGIILIIFGAALLPGPFRHAVRLEWLVPALLVLYGLYLISIRHRAGAGNGDANNATIGSNKTE